MSAFIYLALQLCLRQNSVDKRARIKLVLEKIEMDNPKASRGSGRIIFTLQRHGCLEAK
jgi:hypothetical protein